MTIRPYQPPRPPRPEIVPVKEGAHQVGTKPLQALKQPTVTACSASSMSDVRQLSARLYERLELRREAGVRHERTNEGLARSVETAMILAILDDARRECRERGNEDAEDAIEAVMNSIVGFAPPHSRLLELAQRYVGSDARQHAPSESELAREDSTAAATAMALAASRNDG